ncbi:hypothetical protein D3C72_1416270 [compost metagenome]
MAGVVDARGDLVHQQLGVSVSIGAHVEQLDPHDADIVEAVEDRRGDLHGASLRLRIDGGGGQGGFQHPVGVDVLAQRIDGDRAVTAARGDHRQFAVEDGGGFQNGGAATDGVEGGLGVGGVPDPDLALAVIAFAAGLQQGGQAKRLDGGGEVIQGRDGGEVHGRCADGVQIGLLVHPVLSHGQGGRSRRDQGAGLGQLLDRQGGHVLELEGDDVAKATERLQRVGIVIGGGDLGARDAGGRAVGLGVEDHHVEAEARGGLAQHPAQLAPAENAEGRSGAQGQLGQVSPRRFRRRKRSGRRGRR